MLVEIFMQGLEKQVSWMMSVGKTVREKNTSAEVHREQRDEDAGR